MGVGSRGERAEGRGAARGLSFSFPFTLFPEKGNIYHYC